VSTAGGEALVTISASPRWRIAGSYGLFTVKSRLQPDSKAYSGDGIFDASTPRHQGTVRSLFVLPGGVDLDTSMYLAGAIGSGEVPRSMRVDTRIGWRVRPAMDLSFLARNLLDSRHREFAAISGFAVATNLRRQISVTTTWRF
jgi:iron complex outermembrane receptor protein